MQKDRKRIVIKIGTKVLTTDEGKLDNYFLEHIVEQVVQLRKQDTEVVLVTSGAGGAGKSLLSLQGIESEIVRKQIFAAVGQVKLMSLYAELFAQYGYLCAQVLATKEDFRDEIHYQNMLNCFEGLLLDNVVPIVNENDVVATTELMFTDNDELAGLVATQLKADTLIILTSTDGILDSSGNTIFEVDSSNLEQVANYIIPDKSTGGRGGMTSKFAVAKELAAKGITVQIINGKTSDIGQVVSGQKVGTRFIAVK